MGSIPAPDEQVTLVGQVVAEAAEALTHWAGREDRDGVTYVAAGHKAVAKIDAAIRLLHTVRASLVRELRLDEDERARRIDSWIPPGDDNGGEATP